MDIRSLIRKIVFGVIALLATLAALDAAAQTVTLTASNTRNAANVKFTGKLCYQPTNNSGTAIGFVYGGGGQGTSQQVCAQVTAGELQSGVTVPDTYATDPQWVCLYTQLIDPSQPLSKQVVRTIPCLQPASGGQTSWCTTTEVDTVYSTTCNLDNYNPANPALVVQQVGIQGPAGPTGPAGPAGPGGSGTPGGTDISTLTGSDFGVKLSACIAALNTTYGGICEARTMAGAQTMAANVTISTPDTVINLPCGTITTSAQFIVAANTRNVTFHGCGFQGGSNASGTQGATVLAYTGSTALFKVGDTTYANDTKGFHLDNVKILTLGAGSSAMGLAFYRTQEIDLRSVYLNGDQGTGQTAIYLDGTGDYTGGSFDSNVINGYATGVYMTGHLSGSVVGDYANASTFTRLHITCPTSGGNPVAGSYGVNIVAADGNTWSGGDIEGCATMFHLGANAVNNTIVGLRNENSTMQYVADSGSSFNSVTTGGTFFTGQISDAGSRNKFSDAFHRTDNGLVGDWYASQNDVTITDHQRLGIGLGNERGRATEVQTDYGYRWLYGLSDGTAGNQNYFIDDLVSNVSRLSIGQYLGGGITTNTVTALTLTSGGVYTSSTPPTVNLVGAGGTGATGAATMTANSSAVTTQHLSTKPGTGTSTKTCNQSACDIGGTYDPTSVSESYGLATPTLCASNGGTGCVTNGTATFSMTSPAVSGWTEELWPSGFHGAYDAADTFVRSGWFEVPSATYMGNLEFDTYQSLANGQEYMFGWQCNNQSGTHLFQYDGRTGGWRSTAVPCNLVSGHVYYFSISMHRDASTSTGCSGAPCQYWDGFTFWDATAGGSPTVYDFTGLGYTWASSTNTWADELGLQWQTDCHTTGSAETCSVTVDSDTLVATSAATSYSVTGLTLTAAGTGYTAAPSVTFSGSNQTTAAQGYATITGTIGGTNDQTVINAAGTGAVILNGSNNSGTGGVVFGSGGPTETTVATIDQAGNAQFLGTLLQQGQATFNSNAEIKNGADQENDFILWSGLTTPQKESLVYKDYTGLSQWYLVEDASDNMALNSAVGGLDSFKAYQSTNSGDTYIGASNSSGVVRVNYETGSGTAFKVYGGSSSSLYASFTGANVIQFPGLAASSGHYCLQIDNSGYITNTGSACGTGGGGGSVTSVGLSLPSSLFSVAGSPITGGGTLTATFVAQAVNCILGGPATGTSAAAPTCRALVAADLPAATPSVQGAVILPSGASGNTLGTAAMQATAAFDASGAAATAQGNAEAFGANASNISTGTLPHAQLPALVSADIPANAANTSGNAATATKLAANTLGCLDGWDHLPCTVYVETPVSESTPSGSYATVWTSPSAGVYRVTAYVYGTTASSTAYTVTEYLKTQSVGQPATNGMSVSAWQIGTTLSGNGGYANVFNLASGIAMQTATFGSGTNTGGAWTRAIVIERLQ